MRKNSYMSAQYPIQIAIGLYFFISGLLGIMGYNSGTNQIMNNLNSIMGRSNYIPLIISICFLISGLTLVIGLFITLRDRFIFFIIFILWIVYIVLNYFTDNFLEPGLLPWIKELSLQLIILAGLWNTTQKIK